MGKKRRKVVVENTYHKPKLKAMNSKQQEYINAIKNHNVILGTGVAGSGKSYIASVLAADMLLDTRSSIERIILTRPNESEGTRSIGLLPGTLEEKLAPILIPLTQTLKEALGASQFDYMLKKGVIEFVPLEMIKGRTFNNSIIICDESEDIEWSILKALLLRIGKDSKLIIDGDLRQTSISRTSGLQVLWDLMDNNHLPIKHVDFDSWDYCVRSDTCRLFGQAFEPTPKEPKKPSWISRIKHL